jgi:hypothetical protein
MGDTLGLCDMLDAIMGLLVLYLGGNDGGVLIFGSSCCFGGEKS